MKYRLRSLMIVVTLACVLLGGKIEYLRRMASFHGREAERIRLKQERDEADIGEFWSRVRHDEFRKTYEHAIYRPWTIVREPKSLIDEINQSFEDAEPLPNSSAPAPIPPKE